MKTKTTILGCFAALFMSGCAALGSVVQQGARANDEALASAEFTICRGASVGSVMRKYNTEEKALAWQELCINKETLLIPVNGSKVQE